MNTELLKMEAESETCCVCGAAGEELSSPEEHDATAPLEQPPLRSVLLHLNNTKTVPSGRLCPGCIHRALEAYSFSTMLAAKGPPPLGEKIKALRKRLHELTQKIDVFIVVGGGEGGAYSEQDIITVERDVLAAAARADAAEPARARDMRGDHVYQCSVCPLAFRRAAEYRAHAARHPADALHSCWTCGAQHASAAAAARHAAAHAPRPAHCHLCDTAFRSGAELRRHEAACAPRCPACGLACESRAALARHARAHPALCPVCFLTLESAAARAAHELVHRQARQLVCGFDGCILRFAARAALLTHIRRAHAAEPPRAPAPPLACDACDREFASVAALKRHSRVHRAGAPPPARDQEGPEWGGEGLDGKVEYLEVETLEDVEEQ